MGIDLTILLGLLRFSLKWKEEDIQVYLRGRGIELSQATISLHSIEALVRWQLFCEERLLHLAHRLRPYVLQVDGTTTQGGPVTLRVREAKSGLTLFARQVVAESFDALVPALLAVKVCFGDPAVIVRDDGAALQKALGHVFPGVPQQLDHFHFLSKAGEHLVKEENERLKAALVDKDGMADLAHWSRALPTVARTPESWVGVVARLAAEEIEATRSKGSCVPFHMPYFEAWKEMTWLVEEIRAIIHARTRNGWTVDLSPLVELKRQVEELLARPEVKDVGPRLESLVWGLDEVRRAMRLERDRRTKGDLGPMMEADVAQVKEAVVRTGTILRGKGDRRLTELWGRFEGKFREEEPYLWVVARVPGLTRSTVPLERDHRGIRTGVRHRTGRADTGEEVNLLGALLAYWDDLTNPWFIENVLTGVNLREVFARQDPEEVRRRREALPWEGRRPCVRVAPKRRREALEKALTILRGTGDISAQLTSWAREELLEVAPAV